MVALVVGTLLALAALAYVLYPLFVDPREAASPARDSGRQPTARDEAVAALREVEFDRETGKLSDSDYSALKGRYTAEAVAAMRAEVPELTVSGPDTGASRTAPAPSQVSDDLIEAEIRRARQAAVACLTCGPRPEPDATYCSSCGRYLPGQCAGCGETVDDSGARFCARCGHTLAA